MAKKNQSENKPENTEIESAQPDLNPSDQEIHEHAADVASEESPVSDANLEAKESADDLLDDIRRSLIEEETDRSEQDSKWWRRIGRKPKKTEQETPPVSPEIDLPAISLSDPLLVDAEARNEPAEEYVDSIDELIDALEAESLETIAETTVRPSAEAQPQPEPEPKIDFEQLKEQAFRPRTAEEETQSDSDVRSIALEDGEEVFVEVQAQTTDPMQERMSAFENALKPYRRYIYTALALLGVAMAVTASLILFNVYQRSRPVPTTQPSNLPYPTAVSLPGGWSFQLGKGTVQNGRWEPNGAEWLEGTEVCRWVALPWSTQLEAVLRTLNPKDPIELLMSNNDKLVYEVYSIRQLTPEEMQQLDSNSPCLLLILTQSDSEKRWVLTALR
ncbi:MAG TPA: hypothetical protein VK897_17780 [Anaerolineales bacterium]|nr:hypothetical protein [Anaerolineales bacterium]